VKAVYIEDYGGGEVTRFGEQPTPKPEPNEVLVAVHAASINPVDWKIRAGYVRQYFPVTFPYILGRDFSGVVAALGGEVRDLAVGDEIFGMTDVRRGGSHAEFAAVGRDLMTRKPKALTHIEAASLPLAGATAIVALEEVAGMAAGQRVLIHAGAGGVGGFAIQLAKHRGCWVAATCGTANVAYVRALGADQVIDYTAEDFTASLRDIDLVFDTMGGEVNQRSAAVLKSGGCLVQIAAAPITEKSARADIVIKPAVVRPGRPVFERIAALAESGAVRPQLGPILPLAEAAQGYEASRTGHIRGKIVLRVPA
jgi:NADPH:quinone reductase-like Zn-dependent oxidoreductase